MDKPEQESDFPVTRWTMIQRVSGIDPHQQQSALEEFCRAYWKPLFSYARMRGNSVHDSEDAVQEFLSRLLKSPEKKFSPLDPASGKLRSWLLTGFHNFLISQWIRSRTKKRGGDFEFVSAKETNTPVLSESTHDESDFAREFDRTWAETVMERAKTNLQELHDSRGKSDRFRVLEKFLTQKTDADSAARAAEELSLSVGSVRMALSRLRDDYRESILREIRDTVGTNVDINQEFDYLISCLR